LDRRVECWFSEFEDFLANSNIKKSVPLQDPKEFTREMIEFSKTTVGQVLASK